MVSGKRKENGARVRKRPKKSGFGEPFAERNPAVTWIKAEAIKNPNIIFGNSNRHPKIRRDGLIGKADEMRRKKDRAMLKEAMRKMEIEKTFLFSVIIFLIASFGEVRIIRLVEETVS